MLMTTLIFTALLSMASATTVQTAEEKHAAIAKLVFADPSKTLAPADALKVFLAGASKVTEPTAPKKRMDSTVSPMAGEAGGEGFFESKVYTTSDCSGPKADYTLKYGLCIESKGSAGEFNSYFVNLDSQDSSGADFTITEYSDSGCATESSSYTVSYSTGCNNGVKYVGFSDSYSPAKAHLSIYYFNSNADCTGGDTNDVISAVAFSTGDCYKVTNAYSYQYTCGALQEWGNGDCSGTPFYGVDDVNWDSVTCTFSDDDFNADDDDNYHPIEYYDITCLSGASASSAVGLFALCVSAAVSLLM